MITQFEPLVLVDLAVEQALGRPVQLQKVIQLGFRYFGPVDGHNMTEMLAFGVN